MLRVRRVDAVDDRLDVALDDRERRAQLVADVGEQPPALRLVDLEARRHRVERAAEIAQLARAAVDLRDTRRVVAGLDPPGRLDERVQRRPDPPASRIPNRIAAPPATRMTATAARARSDERARSVTRPSSEPMIHSPMTPMETKTSDSRRTKHPNRRACPRRRQGGPHGPFRPRGPHHGGPRHSGRRPRLVVRPPGGPFAGTRVVGAGGGHVRAPARRRGSRRRRRSGRSAARAGPARSSGGCS